MWSNITESEIWFDYLTIFMKDLIRRKLALDDTSPLDDFIEVETDSGICEVSLSFSDVTILNMACSRAGNLYEEINYLDYIFNDDEKRPTIDIRLSLYELGKYNDIVVLPLYTNILYFKDSLFKENNLSFVFQDSNIKLDNSFKNLSFLNKLVIFDKRLFHFNSNVLVNGIINNKVINNLYMSTHNYKVSSCYINHLYTYLKSLDNFDSCIVNNARVLNLMDFDTFINGSSALNELIYLIQRLSYLHSLENKKVLDFVFSFFNLDNNSDIIKDRETSVVPLSGDKYYLYLCDRLDDSGYIYYFDLMLDDYLRLLSDKFSIPLYNIKVLDILNRVVSLKHSSGLEIIVFLSLNSCEDMYSLIFNEELNKYK